MTKKTLFQQALVTVRIIFYKTRTVAQRTVRPTAGARKFSKILIILSTLTKKHLKIIKQTSLNENKELTKIKLWRLKEKIKKAVKDQVKAINATSKTYDDWSKGIMRVAAKVCGVSKGGSKTKNVVVE